MNQLPDAETGRLLAAIENDDVETVRRCVENGFPPDGTLRPDKLLEPFTLCESASARGALGVLRYLIQAGADVNKGRHSRPLNAACNADHPKAVRLLLEAGADPNASVPRGPEGDSGWTPILFAAAAGNREVAALLLEAGADPGRVTRKGVTALGLAAGRGDLDLVRLLLDAGAPISEDLLVDPVREGKAPLVRLLIAAGAEVNAVAPASHPWVPRLAPLEIAIQQRNQVQPAAELRGLVRQLFDDLQARPPVDVSDRRQEYLSLIEALIDAGADLNRITHARSPVYTAVYHNDVEALRLLLARGADPNSGLISPSGTRTAGRAPRGPEYHSALHCAAEGGFEEAARLLIEAGADPNRPDFAGRTPLEAAERKGQQRLAKLLRAYS